jgi:hypothetical protein
MKYIEWDKPNYSNMGVPEIGVYRIPYSSGDLAKSPSTARSIP